MKEITRKEAVELIKASAKERVKTGVQASPVAICYRAKWFDVRGMTKDQLDKAMAKLLNEDKENRETDLRKQEAIRNKDKETVDNSTTKRKRV